ncbi:hypothetical protein K2173_001228 [Erythroxylum novogranatense]|uniref:Uncharacterized protein n=1 Tax=Erythroxylum novogranatense TaxID=1862640 RepID=A0AAV8T339_9ROSI|nr:hypothetical protein K2173_001228 [Erythroxylum novogranatense]
MPRINLVLDCGSTITFVLSWSPFGALDAFGNNYRSCYLLTKKIRHRAMLCSNSGQLRFYLTLCWTKSVKVI